MSPLIVIAGSILLTGVSLPMSTVENPSRVDEYIVKTQNEKALQRFAEDNQLELGPFLTYPNPSRDALERFSCYHMITILEDLGDIQEGLVAELEALPGVCFVEPNLSGIPASTTSPVFPDTTEPHVPNDPWFSEQYGPRITKVDMAWTLSTGEGVVIVIIGSGVDTDHEDLLPNLDLQHAWDFEENDADVEDWLGHETSVIGVAGAKIDNMKGIAGVAGNCTILPLCAYMSQTFANAIIYAADQEADIISISWLISNQVAQPVEEAVEYAWVKGVFLCAAAGNYNIDIIQAPASLEHVMSIGGTDSQDQRWVDSDPNYGSNFGPGVDIYAPADSIISTLFDGTYGPSSGTSFATPLVAGVAVLVKSVYPEYTNQNIWNRLLASADTITIDKGKVLRVNAAKAVGIGYEEVVEQPGNSPDLRVTSIGSNIVFSYSDSPGGFHAAVFDASGRKVDELTSPSQSGVLTWGEKENSGVYFIVPQGIGMQVQKVILVK